MRMRSPEDGLSRMRDRVWTPPALRPHTFGQHITIFRTNTQICKPPIHHGVPINRFGRRVLLCRVTVLKPPRCFTHERHVVLTNKDTVVQRHHSAQTKHHSAKKPFCTAAGTAGGPGEDVRVHWPLHEFLSHKKFSPSYHRRRALGTGLR